MSWFGKLRLPQSLRDVMAAEELKDLKPLGPITRKMFVKSVIRARIAHRAEALETKSNMNQKALRINMKESAMRPSIQDVLTIDLVKLAIQFTNVNTVYYFMSRPMQLDCLECV